MSDLTYAERQKLEELFQMSSGHVLTFTDYTFGDFVTESTGKDIYDDAGTYAFNGQSKAKRLRAFWKVEPNYLVGKLTRDMLELCGDADPSLLEECHRITARLTTGASVPDLGSITPVTDHRNLDILATEVREAINNNRPQAGVDRLHSFAVAYMRARCDQHEIDWTQKTPLHSLFHMYANVLKNLGLIDSKMGVQIIKRTGDILQDFSHVRNNQSLAHPNALVGEHEALLIYNYVCSVIRYLNSIESDAARTAERQAEFDSPPS